MATKPRPIDSGWCQSGHHRRCAHQLQVSNGARPELWCGCGCHDEKAHPIPDMLVGQLEALEHAAGQLWHVDLPDLLDQVDVLDPVALRFAYERLCGVLRDLEAATGRLLLHMDLDQ